MLVIRKLMRLAIAVLGGIGGYELFAYSWPFVTAVANLEGSTIIHGGGLIIGTFSGAIIAYLVAPFIMSQGIIIMQWSEAKLQKVPVTDVVIGAGGLIVG